MVGIGTWLAGSGAECKGTRLKSIDLIWFALVII